jgi:hypothetical protein
MKTPTLTLAAATLALATGLHAEGTGTLRFLNEDAITGNLQTLAREHIVWNSPSLERPATFFTSEIRDLVIESPIRLPDSAIGHEATLTLTNGDVLRGQLASVTDKEISLDTWYAGRLIFRRVMVRDLAVREMPEFVFRGPGPIADWLQKGDSQAWTAGDANSLVSQAPGMIARDIPLPDEFSLEFEVQWQGSLRLQLILCSKDATAEQPDEGYDIMLQRQTLNVRRRGEGNWIGQNHRAFALQRDEKAKIRLQISKRTGKIAYFVNDKILDVWTDADINGADLGSAMHLVSLDSSPLVISRIDVSKWDGTLDEEPKAVQGPQGMMGFRRDFGMDEMEEEAAESEAVEEGTMVLRNGDRIRGTVKSIEEGKILIETPFREVTLPVERLRTIALNPVSLEEPKRENGDIRASFSDGGSIVFRLEGVSEDGKALLGYSQTFGNARFDLTAFNRVEFNIYPLYRAPR